MEQNNLNSEKRRIAAALENKLSEEQAQLCYSNVRKLPLPLVVKKAFRNQAALIFQREKPVRLVARERFRFGDPTFQADLDRLRNMLVEQLILRPSELKIAIENSVNLGFELYVRPFYALEWILFRSTDSRSKSDMISILNALDDSLPVVISLAEHFASEANETITKSHFRLIIQEIREDLYGQNPFSTFQSDLEQFGRFYAQISDEADQGLHRSVFEMMCSDRDLPELAQTLAREISEKGTLTIQEFEKFLQRSVESQASAAPHFNQEAAPTGTNSAAKSQRAEELSIPIKMPAQARAISEPAHATEAVVADQEYPDLPFSSDEKESYPSNAESNAEQNEDADDNKNNHKEEIDYRSTRDRERSYMSFDMIINRDDIEKQPPGPYPSLYTFIDLKSRKVFIKKIFANDEQAFSEFVERIDSADSWKEAKMILDEELDKRNISAYNGNTIKLSDTLFSRYFSRNRY